MHRSNQEQSRAPATMWILAMLCMAAVIFALCGGAAYTAVRQARLSSARATIGQVEAVLFLAEQTAEQNGLGPSPPTLGNLLKSYDDGAGASLSAYEKYVLDTMLEILGGKRDFDFAVTRFEDTSGVHTQVYLFPTRGKTDMRRDRYYLKSGSAVTEHNT